MPKFKVGDRVLIDWEPKTPNLWNGKTAVVVKVNPVECQVRLDDGSGHHGYFTEKHLSMVEPLKLEVGAAVTIGDGKDEWEVTYVNRIEADLKRGLARCVCGVVSLTVVKAKPEPPKPDYYVNCKGERPKHGDVFVDDNGDVAWVKDDRYVWLDGGQQALNSGVGYTHSIGSTLRARTLLVRDGLPYTGNV